MVRYQVPVDNSCPVATNSILGSTTVFYVYKHVETVECFEVRVASVMISVKKHAVPGNTKMD